ncbi:uncharacterized protein B0H64DRAFT_369205 [Chaetomium fimeti]|uniref:Uncharacterized protein n=1 Tax=Chaetomium fimeti TaxID=1854472 RepID=A0AAE0LX27_9PEZI|nr:hypothetical protein B0H64DRAFT_369205 [Chaetomium fimeti]
MEDMDKGMDTSQLAKSPTRGLYGITRLRRPLAYGELDSTPKLGTTSTAEPSDHKHGLEPCTFFFYDTLMGPNVLMTVPNLDDRPRLQGAWIDGFTMKMWSGKYPVVLPRDNAATGPQDRDYGEIWRAATIIRCLRLQRSNAMMAILSTVWSKWARDSRSSELVEGNFDMQD